MKALALIALITLITCTSGTHRSHNALARHRRAETVTQEERDSIICTMSQCYQKFATFFEDLKGLFTEFNQDRINEQKLTKTCEDYYSLFDCIRADGCQYDGSRGSRLIDVVNTIMFANDLCGKHKEAFVKHGACVIKALKGDSQNPGCEHLDKHKDVMHTVSTPTGMRRLQKKMRRQSVNTAAITASFLKIKEAARRTPAIDCTLVTGMDACIKGRVQDKCNEDGSGEAVELAIALFKENITRFGRLIRGLLPDRDEDFIPFDVERCFRN